MTQVRERIHRLVDQLVDAELPAIESLLVERRAATDPVLQALANAPDDDEPLTDEEIAALDEAYADIAAGRVVSHAEARRRLSGPQRADESSIADFRPHCRARVRDGGSVRAGNRRPRTQSRGRQRGWRSPRGSHHESANGGEP